MKFTARDFDRIVASLAPPHIACSWDNVGFQIGSAATPVRKVLCALEVTPRIIKEAKRRGAQLILVHHPLIFRPLSKLTDDTPTGRLILEIVKRDLCLIAAHTNLDKSPHGTNRALSELLGLSGLEFIEPECPEEDKIRYGMGYVGVLKRAVSLKTCIANVKKGLGIDQVRLVGKPRKRVKRIAVLTGAGGDAVRGMDLKGADVLITGEINHHDALEAQTAGMTVICAGHFATEVIGMDYFARVLRNQEIIKQNAVEILVARQQQPPYKYY